MIIAGSENYDLHLDGAEMWLCLGKEVVSSWSFDEPLKPVEVDSLLLKLVEVHPEASPKELVERYRRIQAELRNV